VGVQEVRWEGNGNKPAGEYVILRGRWWHIIDLKVDAPTEDKIYDVKGSFYEELEYRFDKFPKYHMKIPSRDFGAKVGR
jgi:hypothetical protein